MEMRRKCADYMTANASKGDGDTEMGKRLRKYTKVNLGHGMFEKHGVPIGEMSRWRQYWASCLDVGDHKLTHLSREEKTSENLGALTLALPPFTLLHLRIPGNCFLVNEELVNIPHSAQIPSVAQTLSFGKLVIMC